MISQSPVAPLMSFLGSTGAFMIPRLYLSPYPAGVRSALGRVNPLHMNGRSDWKAHGRVDL